MPDNGEGTTASPEGSPPSTTEEPTAPATGEDALGDPGKQALDRMKAERNAATKRVTALEAEVLAARTASMSEAERAIAEAEVKGRTAAQAEFGKELARSTFDGLAGRRNPDFDTEQALEYVDLSKFLGTDGKPDRAAITAAVERLVPTPLGAPPSFDGGARTNPPPGADMNTLLRQALGRTQ